MKFRKSSYCGLGSCVEVGTDGESVYLRNTSHPDEVMACSRDEWEQFIDGIKSGEFDRLLD